MEPILCDEAQMQRLQRLLPPREQEDGTKGRRLRIVYALCSGAKVADIARKEGLSAQRIYDIKGEIQEKGLETEILRQEQNFLASAPKAKRKRGRPGFETWDQWVLSPGSKTAGEPLVEFASLILTPQAQLAVIAVSTLHPKLKTESDEIFQRSGNECLWTQLSGPDRLIPEVLRSLENGLKILKKRGTSINPSTIRPLKDRFAEDMSFFVLQSGSPEACADLLERLFSTGEPFQSIPQDETLGFFGQLEVICYRFRVQWSCIGLFPCIWELNNDANCWEEESHSGCFVWDTDSKEIEPWKKAGKTVQDYFALNGMLFSLTPSLWNDLPYREEANFRTLPLRPRVDVVRHDPQRNEVDLIILPVPEIAYGVKAFWKGDPEELVAVYRKASANRLRYSVRSVWKIKPDSPLHPTFLKTGKLVDFSPGRDVVLITRHFLCSAPALPLERICELADDRGTGVLRERFKTEGGEIWLPGIQHSGSS